MKQEGKKITMLTAYDYTMARLIDSVGVDILLVGDSAANVMAGHSTTLPITLEQMVYHGASVVRAIEHALVVVDMPFGSYQVSDEVALSSAVRLMKETGCDALKLEGGAILYPLIKRLTTLGIPVMGHLGLTPQSINKFGTYAVRAREEAEANKLIDDAKALQEVGCFALVVEKVPAALNAKVCNELEIPVIGIGAGPSDGQVLVIDDMLGKNKSFSPKFLRRYADLHTIMTDAIGRFVTDVKTADFPSESEQY